MPNFQNVTMWVVAVGFAGLTAACSSDGPSPATSPSAIPTSGAQLESNSGSSSSGGGGRTIRVRCEQRGTQRSKISVDGNNLAAGNYRARVTSGANVATSGLQAAIGDEVEFDFDSNRNDIAAGATRIAATFIQGGQVTGQIRNAAGAVVAAATVACEVR